MAPPSQQQSRAQRNKNANKFDGIFHAHTVSAVDTPGIERLIKSHHLHAEHKPTAEWTPFHQLGQQIHDVFLLLLLRVFINDHQRTGTRVLHKLHCLLVDDLRRHFQRRLLSYFVPFNATLARLLKCWLMLIQLFRLITSILFFFYSVDVPR